MIFFLLMLLCVVLTIYNISKEDGAGGIIYMLFALGFAIMFLATMGEF